ncbi:MAG: tryptophan synthase subunit alpha [Proteobacteria bacterium]|nr:tryptophan synthase subunit alpha [Pseudomonadota bacterium]
MTNNKITKVFEELKITGKKVFIPYITTGDPDLAKTMELLAMLAENGADIIELGVPFSDPMADGTVIQRAMERALKSGTTLRKVLQLVSDFKARYSVPIVLMGYFNPFYAYGIETFAKDAGTAGVDAVLTVDLPPEEAKPFVELLWKEGVFSIFLATPVTDKKRIQVINNIARGFIYFVSVTGVTGERSALPEGLKDKIDEIKSKIKLPLVLGFGISGPDIIHEYAGCVDGFVVGSALVKRWEGICQQHTPFRGDLLLTNFLQEVSRKSHEESEDFQSFFRELAEACHTLRNTSPPSII